jgi:hypothetical protein
MSKTRFAIVASALMLLSTPCFAGANCSGSDCSGLPSHVNICRQMVRAHFCPTGVCPPGTSRARYAQQSRCMRHYGGVRIKG